MKVLSGLIGVAYHTARLYIRTLMRLYSYSAVSFMETLSILTMLAKGLEIRGVV